ncbi:MAG: hypothetical protein JJE04_24655 [Acidobacteriia bacterium]|nr:hypothetical protein [Terriglobia bacterium]
MPAEHDNQPITRADLKAVQDDLLKAIAHGSAAMEDRFITAIANSQAEIIQAAHEFVRDAQTELLRGFQAFSGGRL